MKFNVPKVIKSAQKTISKHSPEILTAVGIAGMITTTVLAVKATPKALESIDEEKKRRNRELVKQAKKNGDEECAQISKLKPVGVVKVAPGSINLSCVSRMFDRSKLCSCKKTGRIIFCI